MRNIRSLIQDIFSDFQCGICYTQFEIKTHEPYVLSCGHNICSLSVDELFRNKTIKCPYCPKISLYENRNQIPKNWELVKILGKLLRNKNEKIRKAEKTLDQISTIIKQVNQQNDLIDDFVVEIIKKQEFVKKANSNLIL